MTPQIMFAIQVVDKYTYYSSAYGSTYFKDRMLYGENSSNCIVDLFLTSDNTQAGLCFAEKFPTLKLAQERIKELQKKKMPPNWFYQIKELCI